MAKAEALSADEREFIIGATDSDELATIFSESRRGSFTRRLLKLAQRYKLRAERTGAGVTVWVPRGWVRIIPARERAPSARRA